MDLEELERRLWTGGAEAFASLMAEDGTVVVPMADGIRGRAATIEMLSAAPVPDRVAFTEIRRTAIGAETAFTYRADAEYDGQTLSMLCTSVWVDGRLALHQQTPLPESEL